MIGYGVDYGVRGYRELDCCFVCDHSRGYDATEADKVFCTKFEFVSEGHYICDDFDMSKEYSGN